MPQSNGFLAPILRYLIKVLSEMKNTSFLALILCLFLVSFKDGEKKFPSLNVKSLDGKSFDFSKEFAKNKLTVVSYWATWCSPCKKELDAIKELYPNWQKDGIGMVAVTIDNAQQLNKVKPLLQQKKWPYQVISDVNSESLRNLGFQTIPQTFVVNQAGNIIYSHSGYNPGDEYELEKKLKSFLN